MTKRPGHNALHRQVYREQNTLSTVEPAVSSVAVAIVNYNTREHLRACLASVASERCEEVMVVDNASSDDTVEMIRANYPWVKLLTNNVNHGYGAAANKAIASCSASYVLLLNSDTLLRPGTVQALSQYLDQHPETAIVGPRLVNADGSLQASCFPFPTLLNTFLQVTLLGELIRYIPFLREHHPSTWTHAQPRVVPWVLGAALAIRREAFEAVGGFDESFFMFSEEVDLCYRLGTAGWQIHYAPVATVVHVGGASTAQHRVAMEAQRYASTQHFYRRHYSRWRLLQLKLLVTYSMFRNSVRDAVRLYVARRVANRATIGVNLVIWRRVLRDTWKE